VGDMVDIYVARSSDVKVNGKTIEGLQSIELKVVRPQTSIGQIGTNERIAVEDGLLTVTGKLKVISTCPALDELLTKPMEEAQFQLVVTLKRGDKTYVLAFDECYLEDKTLELAANGVAVSTYTFTATRMRKGE